MTAIRRPGASSDTTSISYTTGLVTSLTREGVTTGYSRLGFDRDHDSDQRAFPHIMS